MSLDKIQNIKKISKSLKTLHADQLQRKTPQAVEPNRERFKALMQQETRTTVKTENVEQRVGKPSLMEEAGKVGGKVDPSQKATTEEIIAQTKAVIRRIDTVKEKLATPELQLKPSVQTMLRKKLHHIDENIKTALTKAGSKEIAFEEPKGTEKALTPIHRFLGLLAHGQHQLDTLSATVQEIGLQKDLSPAAMLAIQIKVNRVQQEIELFTSLLNKALESTKTIMNIQV